MNSSTNSDIDVKDFAVGHVVEVIHTVAKLDKSLGLQYMWESLVLFAQASTIEDKTHYLQIAVGQLELEIKLLKL